MIAAILKAQLLSMRVRRGTRRASTVFSVITGLIYYSFWSFLASTLMLFFSMGDQTPLFVPALCWALLFVMLYWQVAPIISASFGASLDLSKLLAYPIPHRKLFLVEILLRVTTGVEMVILLAGAVAGLLRNPVFGWRQAPGLLTGAALFAVTNVLLAAGTRNWLERVFLRTRLKEALMFLVVFAAVAPQILIAMHVPKQSLLHFAPTQVIWPWGAAAHLMLGESGRWGLAGSMFWLGLAAWFSRVQFERSLRYDGARLRRPRREARSDGVGEALFRLPSRLLPDPLGAIVEKELRTFSRIPRFRLVYVMSCSFGIILYLPSLRRAHGQEGFFLQNALPFMALYGLLMLGQISYWNAFGFDRSATLGYFAWPIRFRDVLIAKNLSVVTLLLPQILVIALICRAAGIPMSAGKVLETILVMSIAALYWLGLGNIFSVRLPRAMDPGKMNQMANKMQALSIWAAPVLLFPLGLAYWSRWFFGNELVFAGLLAVAAIVGGIFYGVGLDSAVGTALEKREKMLQELSRSDGPVSLT